MLNNYFRFPILSHMSFYMLQFHPSWRMKIICHRHTNGQCRDDLQRLFPRNIPSFFLLRSLSLSIAHIDTSTDKKSNMFIYRYAFSWFIWPLQQNSANKIVPVVISEAYKSYTCSAWLNANSRFSKLFWLLRLSSSQTLSSASYMIHKIAGSACAGNAGNVFPVTDFKGNR